MKQKRIQLTPDQRRSILATMTELITVLPNGAAEYKPGYSDRYIAHKYSVTLWVVQNLRRSFFGIKSEVDGTGQRTSPQAQLWTRIHSLEAEVTELKKHIAELESDVNSDKHGLNLRHNSLFKTTYSLLESHNAFVDLVTKDLSELRESLDRVRTMIKLTDAA